MFRRYRPPPSSGSKTEMHLQLVGNTALIHTTKIQKQNQHRYIRYKIQTTESTLTMCQRENLQSARQLTPVAFLFNADTISMNANCEDGYEIGQSYPWNWPWVVRHRGSHTLCQPYAPDAFNPRAVVQLEGLDQLKNPMTSGMEPATFPASNTEPQSTTLQRAPAYYDEIRLTFWEIYFHPVKWQHSRLHLISTWGHVVRTQSAEVGGRKFRV
jgi:hypothetical protein